MRDYTVRECDVLVIGAGGAGLRAAAAAHAVGAKVAVACRSLLGKAHTVMAEGGIAAALGTIYPQDDWRAHFRDTMRGGKGANNWRMAELHAQEAPARLEELESRGAVFDRTADGRMSQRDFGGHRYARLVHIGDRTGLEILRTLQQRLVALGIEVFQEHTVLRLLHENEEIAGALAYERETGEFVVFSAKAVVLATGGAGRVAQVTSNSWESVGAGHALALRAGADLIDMEFVQFHPTGMIWPLSVAGILVTEGMRGDGGTLRNSEGRRFMFDYVPDLYRAETAETEQEADTWYADHTKARRTPDLLPRDEVARAINAEVRSGRGSPHGGVFLDIASRRDAAYIIRRLPAMYHQFKELAGVDITREAMEIGPTFHYIMGGVQVDAETAASSVAGLFAAGEVAGGMHGANRLGGNSLSDLLVFGRRAGVSAAAHALERGRAPRIERHEIHDAVREALAPLERTGGPSPYRLHTELRAVFHHGVGLIRARQELTEALEKIGQLRERAAQVSVSGAPDCDPSWGEAHDLPVLLDLAEAVARSALARTESRGGHTRSDYPTSDPAWEHRHNRVRGSAQGMRVEQIATAQMPAPARPVRLNTLIPPCQHTPKPLRRSQLCSASAEAVKTY